MRSFVEYSKVPDKYRLSFAVGEIVRNDVWAENETKGRRVVFEFQLRPIDHSPPNGGRPTH